VGEDETGCTERGGPWLTGTFENAVGVKSRLKRGVAVIHVRIPFSNLPYCALVSSPTISET